MKRTNETVPTEYKNFHIETIQKGSFNFFTTARNSKEALMALITNSSDFKNLVKADKDFTINIKQLLNHTTHEHK